MSRPNVLVVVPDQLRADALGAFGNRSASTPRIDALAASGTIFPNTYVQHPVCSPSRASFLTGWYPHTAGHRSLEGLLAPHEPNFLRTFRDAGYHVTWIGERGDTFAPGATELSVHEYGCAVPVVGGLTGGGSIPAEVPSVRTPDGRQVEVDGDVWSRLFYRGRLVSDVADFDEAAVQTVEQWAADPPRQAWVLFVPLLAPHCPFQVLEPWFSQHDRHAVPPPVPAGDRDREPAFMQGIRDYYGTQRAGEEVWREVIATYYGMVSRLDDHVGRILDAIERQGMLENTLTCFFPDHGEYLGDFGLIEKFPSAMHDCITRDPLIISGPGVAVGQRFDGVVELIDAFPTLLDLAGVAATHHHFGRSLVPQCRDATSPHRRYAFSEGGFLAEEEALMERGGFPYDRKADLQHDHPEWTGKAVAVRDEEWTYVWRLYEPPELYNRRRDPSERLNLAGEDQYAAVEERLRSAILRWLVETADVLPPASPRFPSVDLPRPGVR